MHTLNTPPGTRRDGATSRGEIVIHDDEENEEAVRIAMGALLTGEEDRDDTQPENQQGQNQGGVVGQEQVGTANLNQIVTNMSPEQLLQLLQTVQGILQANQQANQPNAKREDPALYEDRRATNQDQVPPNQQPPIATIVRTSILRYSTGA
jgi:hypothetical protein